MTENNSLFMKQVINLLQKAAAAILGVYNSGNFATKRKADNTPLTRADSLANKIITDGLKSITPDIPVLSEETAHQPYHERKLFKEVWILDPVDGTREFVSQNGEFCISLALIRHNQPVAGFIMAPVTNELWYAIKDNGAWSVKNGVTTRLPHKMPGKTIVITHSRSHHSEAEREWIQKIAAIQPVQIVIQGSAIKFCRLAEGSASLYPKLGDINEWDIAAGDIILREAGGKVTETATGREPQYNKESLKQLWFIAFAAGVDLPATTD